VGLIALHITLYGENNMKKHKYPKTRKNRNCSYALSNKIFYQVGETKLRELFSKNGMYIVAGQLTELMGVEVTPNVTNYLRRRYSLIEKEKEKQP